MIEDFKWQTTAKQHRDTMLLFEWALLQFWLSWCLKQDET